jgi:hypothetical protein
MSSCTAKIPVSSQPYQLKSRTYSTTLPGAPDGEYVVIQYQTSFANKKASVETVTPMREKDGRWRVSGYFIRRTRGGVAASGRASRACVASERARGHGAWMSGSRVILNR